MASFISRRKSVALCLAIVVLVGAALVGWIVHCKAERHEKFAAAAARVEAAGGVIDWDLGIFGFDIPARIQFQNSTLGDEDLAALKDAFRELYTVGVVYIDSPNISDEGVRCLLEMKSVEYIGVSSKSKCKETSMMNRIGERARNVQILRRSDE